MSEFRLEAVPKDLSESLLRELVSLVPIAGDLFCAFEAYQAFKTGRNDVALIYLIQALPGPTLPLTHPLVYLFKRGELR